MALPAAAESHAPTFTGYSGLASSDASADVDVSSHKAVLSGAIPYVGPGPDNANATQHPENAFDGSDATNTGNTGNITVDLGGVYVVERVVAKTTFSPLKYGLSGSLYLGATSLPPTYDLTTGVGKVPDTENAYQEYRDFAWINDEPAIEDRKFPAQPVRFLNFHFLQVYRNGGYTSQDVKGIEVYGHPYVPAAGDRTLLSRKKWMPTAFADAAPEGEGETVTHAIDGQLTQTWQPRQAPAPGQWYQVDLGEEVQFDEIYVVFAIGTASVANALNLFASNDPANWGVPIAKLDYGTSDVKPFPLQKARYIRLERTDSGDGTWNIDELNLLAPVAPGASQPTGVGGAAVGGAGPSFGGSGGAPNAAGGTSQSVPGGGTGGSFQPIAGASGTAGNAGSMTSGASARGAGDSGGCGVVRLRDGDRPEWSILALIALLAGRQRTTRRLLLSRLRALKLPHGEFFNDKVGKRFARRRRDA